MHMMVSNTPSPILEMSHSVKLTEFFNSFDSTAPLQQESAELRRAAEVISKLACNALKKLEGFVTVELQGSVAKGTNASVDADLDFFILLDGGLIEVKFEQIKKILVKDLEFVDYWEDYCDSPYLRGFLSSQGRVYKTDWVPCYKPGCGLTSKIDNTVLHTHFVNTQLSSEDKRNVIRLKLFLKMIGAYGADSGGFSGYSCEILVYEFKTPSEIVLKICNLSQDLSVEDPVNPPRNVVACVQHRTRALVADYILHLIQDIPYSYSYEIPQIEGVYSCCKKSEYYRIRRGLYGLVKKYSAKFIVVYDEVSGSLFTGILQAPVFKLIAGPCIQDMLKTMTDSLTGYLSKKQNVIVSGSYYKKITKLDWTKLLGDLIQGAEIIKYENQTIKKSLTLVIEST